jgi:hypothetical protein
MSTQNGREWQSAKKEAGSATPDLLTRIPLVLVRRTGKHTVVETIYRLEPKSPSQNAYNRILQIRTGVPHGD